MQTPEDKIVIDFLKKNNLTIVSGVEIRHKHKIVSKILFRLIKLLDVKLQPILEVHKLPEVKKTKKTNKK